MTVIFIYSPPISPDHTSQRSTFTNTPGSSASYEFFLQAPSFDSSGMRLTFINDSGNSFMVEADLSMKLEEVMVLLEAESAMPVSDQVIHLGEIELSDPKKTMQDYGFSDDIILLLHQRGANSGGSQVDQYAETIRLQFLGNPDLMRQLEKARLELASAARSNPDRFAELFQQIKDRQTEADFLRQTEIQQLNANPSDADAQQKIEEQTRQQTILENMEQALEYIPESFGRAPTPYVPVEVNSHLIKAFVNSGAQQTIMSPQCAEACGITRLIDKRFAGVARGIGTAKILGRVHIAQLKFANLVLPCSFTIMEDNDVDLMLGLDLLRGNRACIDFDKNVLRIEDREVEFLSEHELPHNA